MTDQEINIALAKAIGWADAQIIKYPDQDYIGLPVVIIGKPCVKLFSYKWPSIIWPIAKHYRVFPRYAPRDNVWFEEWFYNVSPTPELAVAMAVIGGAA